MNELTQSHTEHLLSKEWLVKIDNENSVPYLMKVHSSFADQTCVFLITDTKTVWAEVLSRQQLSRRWSICNPNSTPTCLSRLEEDSWLDQALQYLEDVHSLGAMGELSFAVTESRYSDLAIDLRGDGFNWRWETFSIGPKQSADVLSKHLILPLLSTAYLAFISPDAISEISSSDLEKTVDRIGRTARRSVDTHIRNVFSQPRICTSLRRISALFAFGVNTPPITDKPERPQLDLPSVDSAAGSGRTPHDTQVPCNVLVNNPPKEARGSGKEPVTKAARHSPAPPPPGQATMDSATESDDVDTLSPPHAGVQRGNGKDILRSTTAVAARDQSTSRPASVPRSHTPAKATQRAIPPKVLSSDSNADSPPRKNKRPRAETGKGSDNDSDDSDDGPKRGGTRRGTKQPIKRTGRQF